jgi:hypothetical protein
MAAHHNMHLVTRQWYLRSAFLDGAAQSNCDSLTVLSQLKVKAKGWTEAPDQRRGHTLSFSPAVRKPPAVH